MTFFISKRHDEIVQTSRSLIARYRSAALCGVGRVPLREYLLSLFCLAQL
jgi:hypothetical protein